ncbi:unnamed protein product [Candidula unifasciata]|uniref:Uncharacterized protein n=1 Tax=Candidula unifasciata TaxID=100452 RepID=A0A8S3YU21_9EUPU|nr:unnamed protein product [Candidula unifasciata]
MRLQLKSCLLAALLYATVASLEDVPKSKRDSLTATLQVSNLQKDSFEGAFDYKLTEDYVGWQGTATFNVDVTSVNMYEGDSVSHSSDGKTWVFVNKNYKSVYPAGTSVDFRFQAKYTGSDPSGQMVLENMGHDPWTVPEAPNTDDSKYNYNDIILSHCSSTKPRDRENFPQTNAYPGGETRPSMTREIRGRI